MVCNDPSYDLTKHNPKANVHRATPIRRISRGVDDRGDQQVYPYSFRRTRVDQWTSCLYLCLFSTYVHGEARLDTFHHKIIHLREYSARLHVCTNLSNGYRSHV